MSKREIAELACRILALTILVLSIFQIVVVPVQILMGIWNLVREQPGQGYGFTLLASSLSAVLHAALVSFLWSRSAWIATKLVPVDASASVLLIRAADLEVAAFSTVGVIALLNSVWHLCRSIGRCLDLSRGGGLTPFRAEGEGMSLGEWLLWEPTLEALATGAIAIWLILGSRATVQLLRRLRTAGIREQPDRTTSADADVA